MTNTALVTGGAGFIGSHCCRDLLDNGYTVVLVDSLVNSSPAVADRIRGMGGGELLFHPLDIRDRAEVERLIRHHRVDVVVHFAAHKAVGDSVDRPLEYYGNNVAGLIALLEAAHSGGVRRFIFSSSCSIYGDAAEQPITEDSAARPTNPYAKSKWMAELVLEDLCARFPDWSVTALRYFNPAGAHPSGLLGEAPLGTPTNIFPFMAQLAMGQHQELSVFGDDYETPDGTAVRDYIHVLDVVEGHRLALEQLPSSGFRRYNLGTGLGTSVLELIRAFEDASGREIPYRIVGRRPGDVPCLVASPDRASSDLGWKAQRSLAEMCADTWRFQSTHPGGYPVAHPVEAP
ncbi:UDP-glucose 4-epimerase GalE [Arthrobacter sp. MDT3-44]